MEEKGSWKSKRRSNELRIERKEGERVDRSRGEGRREDMNVLGGKVRKLEESSEGR